MGIRGIGIAKSQAFEQAALALTAVVTDPQRSQLKWKTVSAAKRRMTNSYWSIG